MNRRTIWIIVGVIVVIVAAVGIFAFTRFQALIAPVPLEISFATVQTLRPEGFVCAGGGEQAGGVAKEILNLETEDIFVAGGDNAMPDDVWAGYRFPLPLLQNSTRNLMFGGSCFFRSPDAPADCEGDACFTMEEIEGYTWMKLTTVVGNECYPDPSGCNLDVVNPGYVSINTIAKCHRLVWEGPVIYELSDGKGNLYVMHATPDGVPSTTSPVLPEGWTLTERTIDEPLELLPFGGGDDCYYNIIRDSAVQSYHQYAFAGEVYPPQ